MIRSALLFALIAGPVLAADGITPTSLLIGQAAPLSGPAAGLGTGMNQGLEAWAKAVNAQGGIHGRSITIAAIDDGYDPARCADATGELIEDRKVFALAGFVGTPTCKAAIPVLTEAGVPLMGAFTGAGLLRKDDATGKPHRFVLNLRASYGNETEALVDHFVKAGKTRIAVFHQNDSFGEAGLKGTEAALKKRSMTLVGKGTFERNTVAVKTGLAAIKDANPDAVVMVGPYTPIAAFLKEARGIGLSVPMATVSFVGTENLIAAAAEAGEGVIISQVVPSPSDTSVPLVKDYHAALAAAYPDAKPGYVSLEGYATGVTLGAILSKAGPQPTREGLITSAQAIANLDLGGLTLTFGPDDHQGSDAVFLTAISQGSAKPLTP
jgi:ABC-type branched-subunit amino acid transport system substrate-binding protein